VPAATINLVGPSTNPLAPQITPAAINTQVNAAFAQTLADTTAAIAPLVDTLLNITALRALTSPVNPSVFVEGYTTTGDGGEGIFTYNPSDVISADNGGTIIVDAGNHRWYRAHALSQPFSVLWFGASGDGTTDDTTKIQATINAASTAKVSVYFPGTPNFYRIGSALTLTGPISIYGDPNNSTIKTTSATANIFVIAGINVLVDSLRLGSTVAKTAGAYISMPAQVGAIRVNRCYFDSAWIGINIALGVSPSSIIDIENCNFFNTVSNGTGVQISGGFEIRLRHIIMNSGASPEPAAGVLITNVGDATLEDVNIIQHKDCLALLAANAKEIDSVWCTDCYFDTSSTNGVHIGTTGSGVVQRSRFIGCWASSSGGHGVVTSGNVDQIEFIDCHAYNNALGGFYLLGGNHYTLIGCQAAANTGAGCYIEAGADSVTLIGNSFEPLAGFGPNTYGIFLNSPGDTGEMVITGNRVTGNVSGAITGVTSTMILNPNQIVRDNIGFVDHASGSATLLAASTSVVVTHGLSATPQLASVLLTMRSSLASSSTGGIWVSAVSSTTFTITVAVMPGSDIGITWQASLN